MTLPKKFLKVTKSTLSTTCVCPDVQYLDECQFSLQYVSITVTNTTNQSWQFVHHIPLNLCEKYEW